MHGLGFEDYRRGSDLNRDILAETGCQGYAFKTGAIPDYATAATNKSLLFLTPILQSQCIGLPSKSEECPTHSRADKDYALMRIQIMRPQQ